MLKGCQRKIILVKDLGSQYFESAYFVIKGDLSEVSKDSDMLAEAHRIIADCSSQMEFAPVREKEIQASHLKQHKKPSPLFRMLLVGFALICITLTLIAVF